MTTTTTINVELGTAFWLMMLVLIAGIVLYSKMGPDKMRRVLNSGIGDAFGK